MQRANGVRTMTAIKRVVVAGCLAGCLLGAAADAADIPAGGVRWQSTVSVKAMGMTMPGQTAMMCMDPKSEAPPVSTKGDCEMYDYHRSGDTQNFKMRCSGREKMEGSGSITYAGDSYHGSMQMHADQGDMSMEFSGKKQGACDGSEVNLRAKEQIKQVQANASAGMATMCTQSAEAANSPYPFMPGAAGVCKDDAAHKQQYCKNFQTYKVFGEQAKMEAAGKGSAGMMSTPLTDSATLCGVTVDGLRLQLCQRAEAQGELDFLRTQCPVQAAAITKRECAGRSYTSVSDRYRAFCSSVADGDEGQAAKPDAKPTVEDKLKKGKDKLKGLLGF